MSLTQRIFGARGVGCPDPEHVNLGIGPDVALDVLKNERRQRILLKLNESESGRVEIGELADEIAAHEQGVPVEQVTSRPRKAAYVGLYQHHLPKLDRVGLIDYNKDRGVIEITDAADGVVEFIKVLNFMLHEADDE